LLAFVRRELISKHVEPAAHDLPVEAFGAHPIEAGKSVSCGDTCLVGLPPEKEKATELPRSMSLTEGKNAIFLRIAPMRLAGTKCAWQSMIILSRISKPPWMHIATGQLPCA
jgi:hypothetical protein